MDVGQAEDRHVDAVQQFGAAVTVLAVFVRNRHHVDIPPVRETRADLQAGRAGFAVYENPWSHLALHSKNATMTINSGPAS